MKTTTISSTLLLIYFFFIPISIFSQNFFGGIEIGSKGVKMSVIDVKNVKRGSYEIKDFWTENVGIAKGISIDGNLAQADIDAAALIVAKNYEKLLNEYKIEDKKIFIVASSGVGMAKNTEDLINKIKEVTQKDLDIISSQLESKLMFKGCIPPKFYKDALLVDIGGGNTKGGYVDSYNDDEYVFFPLNLNLGTITLTEKINKTIQSDKVAVFTNESNNFRPELKKEVSEMFNKRPLSYHKKNIYTSGGAVWAFYTLFFGGEAPENFNQYSLKNVLAYQEMLQYNFSSLEELGKTNTEAGRVLKTYSQKHLISACNILITSLESIENINDKKIYFTKQGQIAWLLSYISDSAKGSKVIY